MNVDMSVHPVYTRNCLVPDYERAAFTRLRLSSHNLISEKGRWSRIPPNLRICPCDKISVQDEKHAILECSITLEFRRRYMDKLSLHPESTLNELMKNENIDSLCEFIHHCMEMF